MAGARCEQCPRRYRSRSAQDVTGALQTTGFRIVNVAAAALRETSASRNPDSVLRRRPTDVDANGTVISGVGGAIAPGLPRAASARSVQTSVKARHDLTPGHPIAWEWHRLGYDHLRPVPQAGRPTACQATGGRAADPRPPCRPATYRRSASRRAFSPCARGWAWRDPGGRPRRRTSPDRPSARGTGGRGCSRRRPRGGARRGPCHRACRRPRR